MIHVPEDLPKYDPVGTDAALEGERDVELDERVEVRRELEAVLWALVIRAKGWVCDSLVG